MKLSAEVKKKDEEKAVEQVIAEDTSEEAGLSVYQGYAGKTIFRKKDGFKGVITKVDEQYVFVDVTEGPSAGQKKQLSLEFVVKDNSVYTIE